MAKVLAVVPTLAKNIPRLNNAISSIREKTTEPDLEVVVVLNSNEEVSAKILGADRILYPGLNLGYVGAIEWVRETSKAEYLWVVQDDMTLLNDVLSFLLLDMERDENLAINSPLLVRNGVVPAKSRGGVFTDNTRTKWENVPYIDTKIHDWVTIPGLSFVSGSGALFRFNALQAVGGFDVSLFPLMHVDVEISFRLLQAGYRINLCHEAHIEHDVQGSTPRTLAILLDEINRKTVIQKMIQSDEVQFSINATVSPKIIALIASKASQLIIHLSQVADTLRNERDTLRNERDTLRNERDTLRNERDSMISSNSWRITQPLRSFKTWVSKQKVR
jgi:GT2 family glycosyltransferase